MAIVTPRFLGIMAPADDIERLLQDGLNQDADLIGFSVAMKGSDLDLRIAELKAEGCVHGRRNGHGMASSAITYDSCLARAPRLVIG